MNKKLSIILAFFLTTLTLHASNGKRVLFNVSRDAYGGIRYEELMSFSTPLMTNRLYFNYSCNAGHFNVPLYVYPIEYWSTGEHFVSTAVYDPASQGYFVESGQLENIRIQFSQSTYSSAVCSLKLSAEIQGYPLENAVWNPLSTVLLEKSSHEQEVSGSFKLGAVRFSFPKKAACSNILVDFVHGELANGGETIHLVPGVNIFRDILSDRINFIAVFSNPSEFKRLKFGLTGKVGCSGKIEISAP